MFRSSSVTRLATQVARVLTGAFGLAFVLTATGVITSGAAQAVVASSGTAQVVFPNGTGNAGQPETSGAQDTVWTLKLPSGAACTHDTATSGYHVQSFMV